MLPWGHLAVGYLCYALGIRCWRGRSPAAIPTLVLALGTQLPDLIDKPLNWWFGIFDGRGATHSLFVLVPVLLLAYVWARRRERGHLVVALGVGVLTHALGDAATALWDGTPADALAFLAWPLLPAPTYPKDSPGEHVDAWVAAGTGIDWSTGIVVLTSRFLGQIVLAVVVAALWLHQGAPGARLLWRRSRSAIARVRS